MRLKPNLLGMVSILDVILAIPTWGVWLVVPLVRYLSAEYVIGDNLSISHGLLGKRFINIEYYRLKNISGKQSLIERLVRAGTVVLHTSDPAHPVVELRAVPEFHSLIGQIRSRAEGGRKDGKVFIE